MTDFADVDDTRAIIKSKLRQHFDGKIVRKDLTKKIKEGANVPVYVLEFLLGQYCSSDDPEVIEEGVNNVKHILADNFVRPDEAQKILSILRQRGSYTVIDKITVSLNIKRDFYEAEFSNLGLKDIPIDEEYPAKYDRLLCGGIWCIIQLDYEYMEEDRNGTPISIRKLTPIQMPHVDIEELKTLLDENVAAIMMTNPNTLGLFEENILEISKIMHSNGSLLYYDGANLNAIMGYTNPKIMGFDVVHLNLHKTFSTPHGGGGPGAGPIGVVEELKEFLPVPYIEYKNGKYVRNYDKKDSIGKVSSFYGNFSVLLKAYTYILMLGKSLREVSEDAVLNANYIKAKLKKYYKIAYETKSLHEFVLTTENLHSTGVNTLKIAKRLMDYNIHPPTVYFPLIVHEAMMIEPTETESKEVLDNFIDVMIKIMGEINLEPLNFDNYPSKTPVKKVDEVLAARQLNLRYKKDE